MNNTPQDIRLRMRLAIEESGYTLNNFCELYGLSRPIFCGSNANNYPSLATVMVVMEHCNVSADWLITGVERMRPVVLECDGIEVVTAEVGERQIKKKGFV